MNLKLIFCVLYVCLLSTNLKGQTKKSKSYSFTFEKTSKSTEKGINEFTDSLKSNLLEELKNQKVEKDSNIIEFINEFPNFLKEMIKNDENYSPIYTVIENSNNTIWRYFINEEYESWAFERINIDSQKVYAHPKKNLIETYNNYPFPSAPKKFTIKKDTKDTKVILGYKCYKLVLEIDKKSDELNFGNTIYEMYVSKSVKLPIYSILYLNIKDMPFPLEIVQWSKSFPDLKTNIKAIRVEN